MVVATILYNYIDWVINQRLTSGPTFSVHIPTPQQKKTQEVVLQLNVLVYVHGSKSRYIPGQDPDSAIFFKTNLAVFKSPSPVVALWYFMENCYSDILNRFYL